MLKVLIFSFIYVPHVGGAELAVKELTDRIDDIEFDMISLCFDKNLPAYEKVGKVNVYRIGFTGAPAGIKEISKWPLKLNKYLYPIIAWRKASKLHKEKSYDVVWSIMANYSGFAALIFKFFHKQVPYILTLQEGDPLEHYQHRTRFFKPLFRGIFRQADFVTAISTFLIKYARSMGYQGEAALVPNAVNFSHFAKNHSAVELDTLKADLGKQPGDVFLVTASRLVHKNAVDEVIRALRVLPKNIKLLILGTGPDKGKLASQAEENGVGRRIIFAGHVGHEELPKYLQISDIFIRASRSEGFGSSFIEAMAAGLPVIATPVGGIVDFLFDPDKNPDKEPTGVFCEIDDYESIAERIDSLCRDKELRARITQNAKKMVQEKYDWALIAPLMKESLIKTSRHE